MRGGFADSTGFWSMLWWAILQDVPTGLHRVDCPVMLAQGAVDVVGADRPALPGADPGLRFTLLPGAGHAPVRCRGRDPLPRPRTAERAHLPARGPCRS